MKNRSDRSGHGIALVLLLGLAGVAPALAQTSLDDTGQVTCYDDSAATVGEPATHPRQDCRLGRDAANGSGKLSKVGAGVEGFDFTKISNSGGELPASATLGTTATTWACTYDNTTSLMWEVKVPTAGALRYSGYTYSWYSEDSASNGGFPGTPDYGSCNHTVSCDTQSYVAAVNAAGLCGHHDWRMPSAEELLTLVDYNHSYGDALPAIDNDYFPGTQALTYWTGTNDGAVPTVAYYVYFNGGYLVAYDKSYAKYIMVVRSGR